MSNAHYTQETARRFEHGASQAHAAILATVAAERGCTCEAYVDWFTYNRWQGLGYQVQRGEKGVKLTSFHTVEETGKDGKTRERQVPRGCSVFCRCQVKAKEKAA